LRKNEVKREPIGKKWLRDVSGEPKKRNFIWDAENTASLKVLSLAASRGAADPRVEASEGKV